MNALDFLLGGEKETAVSFLKARPELRATPEGFMAAVGRVPSAIREEFETARDLDMPGSPILSKVIGGLGMAFSPLTGASKALVREPVERTAQDLGLSPNLSRGIAQGAQFGAELAVPGVGLTKFPRFLPKRTIRSTAGAEAVIQAPFERAGAAVSEAAGQVASGAKEFLRQVSRVGAKSVSYLDEPAKYSPTLTRLRESIEHSDLPGKGTGQLDFNERTLLATGNFTRRFNESAAGITGKPLRDNLIWGPLKGALPGPADIAAGNVRTVLDEVRQYANQAGLDLGYVKGYFPRVYDTDRLSKAPVGDEFIKTLGRHGIDQADADIILRNLTDGDGIVTNAHAGRSTISRISPEAQRALGEIPDSELSPFLRTNPEEVIPRYISGVVRRAEYARTFGPNNEKLQGMLPQIIKESMASGRPIRADEVKRIEDLSQVLSGDYQRIASPGLRKTNDLLTTYQYIRTLPLSVLSSLTEPFIALERGGVKAAAKAIPATLDHMARGIIRTAFKGVPKAQATKDLEEIGLGLDETLAQVLSDQFSGGVATKTQTAFFKLNLLSPWTRLTQVHAMKTAEGMIKDNLRSLFKKPNARMERELLELGLDLNQAKQWAVSGFRRDSPYYPRIQAANLRFTNQVIMHPRGTVKPMAMSNPKLRLITMLKGYHIMAGNTVVKRMLYKVVKGTPVEKARVAGAVGSMLSVALLSDRIRDYIKFGEEGDPKKKNETGADIFWRALNRTGLTGVLQFANDAVNAPRFGSTGLQQLAGPAVSQAQEFVEAGKAASLGRPSKLQKEVISALPLINITPRTRAAAKEFLFGR